MSELLERELSRVLRDLPGEPAPQPTLYSEVQTRARRIRRRRYAGGAIVAAIAVAIAATVPALTLGGNHAAPLSPAGQDVTSWPARGPLAGDLPLRQKAVAAWQHALTAAHRGRLTEPVYELYADDVPDIGLVVVLAGPEPRGGLRNVVITGSDARHLSLYSDLAVFEPSAISIFLPLAPGTNIDNCVVNPTADVKRLLLITPPGKHRARWLSGACDNNGQPRWHDIALRDGVGVSDVPETHEQLTTVDIDREAETVGLRSLRQDGRQPVERLLGGRVGGAVGVEPMSAPIATSQSGPNGTTRVGISSGGVLVGPGRHTGEAGNPLGWARRVDASPQESDLFGALSRGQSFWKLFPNHGSVATGDEFMRLAMPDGTLIWGDLKQYPTGPTRLQLTAIRSATDVSGYFDVPLDAAHLPVELSAVVEGRDGDRWLAVAGAAGVAFIDYRAPGSSHWQSMAVYESTGFLRLPAEDKGTGTLRLRTTNGTTVYQGRVDALHPLN